ncbi:L,D-transpeptidase family protein [Dyadobacter sp. NIV53]|uniref:L,D-transpeptidase family protein n=1 Tax=Dyadobacter sp. NIV53 TaxID=2861765 RepID=UPI001C867377|nr:L,D-transpeptidase family protein [Dyadobacter sp. NIV53]
MNLNAALILYLCLVKVAGVGQDLSVWKEMVYKSGVDTVGISGDTVSINRVSGLVSYGSRPYHLGHWKIPQKVDSARLKIVTDAVIGQKEGWIDQWKSLEPGFLPYKYLKSYLDSSHADGADSNEGFDIVCSALNEYRWLNRIPSDALIIVNIPSSTLRVVTKNGCQLLYSKVILGQRHTPTPLFGAYLTRIITFPYWNVPRSIATKELLPKIKRNPAATLDNLKMQVLDSQGKIVDPGVIDWKSLSARNFPYRLRQSTGCDNALGVIKFDLNSPYDVYLHDTNHRELFEAENLFLSHGCIRLAKPVELANLVLQKETFTTSFLTTEKTNVPSKIFALPAAIPIIITYQLVDLDEDNQLHFYPDVYGWQKVKM